MYMYRLVPLLLLALAMLLWRPGAPSSLMGLHHHAVPVIDEQVVHTRHSMLALH
jgi:hypothetical protein